MAASDIIFLLAPTSASPGWGSGSAGPFGPSSNLQPRKRGLRLSPRAAFHLPGVPALRSAKALSSGLQPRKRGLRPAVTEGDKGREGVSPTSDGELKIRRADPAKGKAL